MDSQDDDFWTTYIAATPEEDADFAGCGWLAWIPLLLIIFVAVAWLAF